MSVMSFPLVRLAADLDERGNVVARKMAEFIQGFDNAGSQWLPGLLDADPEPVLADAESMRTCGYDLRAEQPFCLEDAARLLVERGRPAEAVPLLEQASAIWAEMGAVRRVNLLEARLRELGVRRGKAGSRRRPATGWGALTETEERVTKLVADGLTYREVGERLFVSRRTVETHVAHVFAKVGVANRAELKAAYLARTSPGDRPAGVSRRNPPQARL